jgi:predicted Zn finger-like uncharacterized protein
MITAACPHCNAKVRVADAVGGRRVRCPKCNQAFPVPPAAPGREAVTAGRGAAPARRRPAAPPDALPDHRGRPLPEDAEFFIPPPDEIGEVLSGHTTLREGNREWPAWVAISAPVVGGALGVVFGVWLSGTSASMGSVEHFLFPILFGLLGVVVLFFIFLFSHTATYVGKEGAAQFDAFWARNIFLKYLLRFCDAAELWTGVTVHLMNGGYWYTSFSSIWYDDRGKPLFSLLGRHHSEKGDPPAENKYHFAQAAEHAWTRWLLPDALRQLEDPGYVQFRLWRLLGDEWIRLDRKTITIKVKGGPVRFPARNIEEVRLKKGVLTIRPSRVSAAVAHAKDEYRFDFADVANRQLFLHLLRELYGFELV